MTRVLSFINQKGGVAKTTSVINTGAALSLLGKKVLLIDFDPQWNLTGVFLSEDMMENKLTIYNLLKEEAFMDEENSRVSIKDVIYHYEKDKVSFDILPASPSLGQAEFELISLSGREFLLRKIIAKIKGYDYLILDCPPSLGILTINALSSSNQNELIIPVKPGLFSRMGIKSLLKLKENLRRKIDVNQKDFKFLITIFSENQKEDRDTVKEIEEAFPDKIFETKIRKNTTIDKAHSFGSDIFNFDPGSNGAIDYMNFAKELIKTNKGE